MKKTVKLLMFLLLFTGVILLSGCGKEEKKEETKKEETKNQVVEKGTFDITKYTKEVKTYTVESSNKKETINVGYTTESDYKKTDVNGTYRLVLENDYNKIELQFYNTNIEKSSTIFRREEKDFDADKIQDFSKYTINGNEGWEVYRLNSTTKKIMSYETQMFLGEANSEGLTNAVKITVVPSPVKKKKKNMNLPDFVNSEDFQYLLYSIKVVK